MARPRGFEPLTPGSEVRCSIQLSYGRAGVRVFYHETVGGSNDSVSVENQSPQVNLIISAFSLIPFFRT